MNNLGYRAFTDTWIWDEAAADRLDMFLGAVARPAHQVIRGLHHVLGTTGMLAYLTYMAERLEQMHRLLKPTGTIYLHCDPTASHYLKILLDAVFGSQHFRNEIIWQKIRSSKAQQAGFGSVHDTIFSYRRSPKSIFRKLYTPLPSERVRRHYGKIEPNTGRRYGLYDFTQSGQGVPRRFGDREITPPKDKHWIWGQSRIEAAMEEGRIVFTSKNMVRVKRYLDESRGNPMEDIWTDIPPINAMAKERLGYPTQKPIKLLGRIIKASSNPGDVVLDPFCGCGTAIESAARLDRRWAGIDISSFAIDLIVKTRMKNRTVPTKGIPLDFRSAKKLARERPFDFEAWSVTRLPGFAPNTRQRSDGGVDGRATLANKPDNFHSRLALAQIKGGHFNLSTLRDFIGVTNRDRAALGCYVTLDPVGTPSARREVANMGKLRVQGRDYRRMQLWPISDYFEGLLPDMPVMNDPYSGKPMSQMSLF